MENRSHLKLELCVVFCSFLGFSNKSSRLTAALDETNFVLVLAMNLLPLCCATCVPQATLGQRRVQRQCVIVQKLVLGYCL